MAKSISTPTAKTKKAPSIKTKTKTDPTRSAAINKNPDSTREDRESLIRNAAYFLAENDGFQPGREQEYWTQAEAQVDQLLKVGPSASAGDKH